MYSNKRKIAVAFCLAAMITAGGVSAQSCKKNIRTGECIENKDKDKGKQAAAGVELKYPNATRQEPSKTSSKIVKEWKALVDSSISGEDSAKTIAAADAVLANPKASKYEQSTAAQIAGFAWIGTEDYAKAMPYLQKAVQIDGLNNTSHFDTLLAIAQVQMAEDKYADAVQTLTRFLQETQSESAKTYGLRGNAYYRLEKYKEAIPDLKKAIELDPEGDRGLTQLLMASYADSGQPLEAVKYAEAAVAKNPKDKGALLNLASVYLQADMPDKAAGVFDRMKTAGLLTETRDYESAYKLLANIEGREKDAIAVIEEGLKNGKLTANDSLYGTMGQIYYFSGQTPKAIETWKKGDELSKSGELALNLSKAYSQEGRYAESRSYALQALKKGVRDTGDAYMTLAGTEGQLGNKAAMVAAAKEAAKYPGTRDKANKLLKQAGAK